MDDANFDSIFQAIEQNAGQNNNDKQFKRNILDQVQLSDEIGMSDEDDLYTQLCKLD